MSYSFLYGSQTAPLGENTVLEPQSRNFVALYLLQCLKSLIILPFED